MVSVILLACYLPLAIVPALVPFRALRPFRSSFPLLAILPISVAAAALLFAGTLTSLLGYAVAFVPLAISFLSLMLAVVGIRFAVEARREAIPALGPTVFASIAAIPFGLTLPYIFSAAIGLVRTVGGG